MRALRTSGTESLASKRNGASSEFIRRLKFDMVEKKASVSPQYLLSINGPLLFTAPHSGRVYRGGEEYKEKRRIHLREKYTAVLAMRFAREVSGSYCVWSHTHKLNETDQDPNYLLAGREQISPFHLALHAWAGCHAGPLFHVDIHGKMDRKDNYELDLGVICMYHHWTEPADMRFAMAITERLTEGFNKVLATIPKYKEYKAICNNDPVLHGLWGRDLRTMTEQAAELRIPTIQLEIPLKMRAHLFGNEAFSKAFLAVITETYKDVISPMWATK